MKKIEKAAKLQAEQTRLAELQTQSQSLEAAYIDNLETDPKYSLDVDPDGELGMSEEQKKFVAYYVQFKSLTYVASMMGIDTETAKQYYISFNSQQEIRRINMALYHRQFANRLINLDEIGGYLTSLLTGDNVPLADQPHSVSERLAIVKMLIDLNKLQIEGIQNPSLLMQNNVEVQIKNLSLNTIKSLLSEANKSKKVPIEVSNISDSELTPEESAYLSTLPTQELLNLIDETNKGDDHK